MFLYVLVLIVSKVTSLEGTCPAYLLRTIVRRIYRILRSLSISPGAVQGALSSANMTGGHAAAYVNLAAVGTHLFGDQILAAIEPGTTAFATSFVEAIQNLLTMPQRLWSRGPRKLFSDTCEGLDCTIAKTRASCRDACAETNDAFGDKLLKITKDSITERWSIENITANGFLHGVGVLGTPTALAILYFFYRMASGLGHLLPAPIGWDLPAFLHPEDGKASAFLHPRLQLVVGDSWCGKAFQHGFEGGAGGAAGDLIDARLGGTGNALLERGGCHPLSAGSAFGTTSGREEFSQKILSSKRFSTVCNTLHPTQEIKTLS